MKNYEMVFEIFNSCAGNVMRDIFFEEVSVENEELLESYIRSRHADKNFSAQKTRLDDGSVIFDVEITGIKGRYTFNPISD